MTPHYVNQGGELNWLLDDLVNRVPQVTEAVMPHRAHAGLLGAAPPDDGRRRWAPGAVPGRAASVVTAPGRPVPAGRPDGIAVDGRNADGPGADGAPVDAIAAADSPATRRALGGLRVQPLSDDGRSIRSGFVRGVVA